MAHLEARLEAHCALKLKPNMDLLWYTIVGLGQIIFHIDPGLVCFCCSVMWPLGVLLLFQVGLERNIVHYHTLIAHNESATHLPGPQDHVGSS